MSQADSSSVINGTTLADDAGGFQTEEPTCTKPPQRTDEDSGRSPKLWQHIAGWFDFGNTDPTSTAGAENPSEHVPGRTPSPDSATTDSEIHTPPPPAKPLTGWAKSEPVKRDPTSWEPLATSPPAAADFGRFANPQAAQAVLADIKADAAYNAIGKQDGKGVSGGESLWAGGSVGAIENSDNGPQDKRDLRQTPSAPPIYSLSPRRQTEDVPGKLLETLQRSPQYSDTGSSPFNTVVVDTHRLNQFPEQYAQRLADAAERGERVVVAASIGGSAGKNEDFAQEKATAQRDLRMLDNTIALLRAAGVPSENIDVVAGQADTPAKAFTAAQPDEQATREANVNELRLQTARGYNSILERHGLGDAAGREGQTVDETKGLPWGGDELASTAIARALPERSVNVIALDKDGNEVNPGTVANYWENNDATSRLIDDALAKNNLRQAEPGGDSATHRRRLRRPQVRPAEHDDRGSAHQQRSIRQPHPAARRRRPRARRPVGSRRLGHGRQCARPDDGGGQGATGQRRQRRAAAIAHRVCRQRLRAAQPRRRRQCDAALRLQTRR
jgi:hypothetical protein